MGACKNQCILFPLFSKVVQQHIWGVVRNIAWLLLQMQYTFQRSKNFENRWMLHKVKADYTWGGATYLIHPVYLSN